MQYTTAISEILKSQGNLNLCASAQRKVNNIIWLEGRIHALKSIKPDLAKAGIPGAVDLKIFTIQRQLTEITHNLKPMELIERLAKQLPY